MHCALEKQINRLDDASAENNTLGVIEVHDRSQAVSQVVSSLLHDLNRQFVVVRNGVGKQTGADDRLAFFQLQRGVLGQNGPATMMNLRHDGLRDSRRSEEHTSEL